LQGKISFLLDNDLSPDIATSLRLFEFDVIHHNEVPQFQNRTDIVEDHEIIQWCRDNRRTWITHDFEARRKHEGVMKAARIHVVWIRGKTRPADQQSGESATWRFYKMLVRTIDELQRILLNSRGAMHFRISTNVGTRPNVGWAESSHDRPKGR
jgi:predicted nuclease of predicted toxin-antitoxin system